MYYRLKDNKLYDYADYQYASDCQETDIITQKQLDKDRRQIIVEEYEEEITIDDEPVTVIKLRLALNPDYSAIALAKAKLAKIAENDRARDEKLNGGVVYQDILFDSDTDQKVNILAIVSTMSDEDTITWFGMNNDSLECAKADLTAIGGLITNLHAFCWTKNAQIKAEIAAAETIEEVAEIEIDYTE